MNILTAAIVQNVAVLTATTLTCIYSGPWGLVCLLCLTEWRVRRLPEIVDVPKAKAPE